MPYMEMVCLANSKKLNGRCVAGLRTNGQGWLRPISDTEDGTLSRNDYALDGGGETEVLDVVNVPVLWPRPEPHQPENWVIDGSQWWKFAGSANKDFASLLAAYLATSPLLFGSTSDRIPFSELQRSPASESLALIVPGDLEWSTGTNPFSGRYQARALFVYRSVFYNLVVTDPVWNKRLTDIGCESGRYESDLAKEGRILLTISLGEPFRLDGCCYKLVAGVVEIPLEWGVSFEAQ